MNISKTTRYLAGAGEAAILAGLPLVAAPSVALAGGDWIDGTLDTAAQQVGQSEAGTASGSGIIEKVTAVTSWLLGIAIVIFVLKVVLTAVDRILFDRESNITHQVGNTNYFQNSALVSIPIIGAYPPPESRPNNPYAERADKGYTWKRIWINFAVQILIAVAAWFFVQIIVSLLLAIFSKTTTTS